MWYVYILRSQVDNFVYVGSTNDVKRRLSQHNSGEVESTKSHPPFEIVAFIAVENKDKAIELERYFKSGSGRAFISKRIL
jgi:putative endonuclease